MVMIALALQGCATVEPAGLGSSRALRPTLTALEPLAPHDQGPQGIPLLTWSFSCDTGIDGV